MKIYLKLGNKPKSIKELLLLLFSHGEDTRRTNVETYLDEACLSVQCNRNKYRSLDEVVMIVTTYFPKASLKEIIHELLVLDFGLAEPIYIKMTNCSTIRRIVLYYSSEYFTSGIFDINKYNSQHSWDELLFLLGLKSVNDVKAYVKKYIKTKETISDRVNGIEALEKHCKDFKTPYSLDTKSKLERAQNAFYVLARVAEVYNEGTELIWNGTNIHYLPYKYFSRDGGSTVGASDYWDSYLSGSACLYLKSPRLSEDCYNNFTAFWEDYWAL